MSDKKDLQAMIKDAFVLFAITLLSGLILGFVYELTKEPIRLQQERAIKEACQEVLQEAQEFEKIAFEPSEILRENLASNGVKVGTVYQATSTAGEKLGYVIESSSSEGYGGTITLYVGVLADGTLNGVSILKINETPGLGMRAEEVLVPQFAGRQENSFIYTKTGSTAENEIDAITGATVTTEAVTYAVNGGLAAAQELLQTEGGAGNE